MTNLDNTHLASLSEKVGEPREGASSVRDQKQERGGKTMVEGGGGGRGSPAQARRVGRRLQTSAPAPVRKRRPLLPAPPHGLSLRRQGTVRRTQIRCRSHPVATAATIASIAAYVVGSTRSEAGREECQGASARIWSRGIGRWPGEEEDDVSAELPCHSRSAPLSSPFKLSMLVTDWEMRGPREGRERVCRRGCGRRR